MRQFEGRTAIVTGAGSGIGLCLARTFAGLGMSVVLCDVRKDRLDGALAEVRALGARAIAVPTDVSDRASVRDAADAAVSVVAGDLQRTERLTGRPPLALTRGAET